MTEFGRALQQQLDEEQDLALLADRASSRTKGHADGGRGRVEGGLRVDVERREAICWLHGGSRAKRWFRALLFARVERF